jgi:hypothetical protein
MLGAAFESALGQYMLQLWCPWSLECERRDGIRCGVPTLG